MANQLNNYFVQNDRFSSFQSAYRSNHSTETALLRVVSDIQCSNDDHKEVILVLLDLSSAFDILDHIILLGRLRDYYGISGTVLRWLETYLSERSQTVVINMASSDERQLVYRVPQLQGSVLGPLLFAFYFAVIHAHGLNGMLYADDTQLYISLDSKSKSESLSSLQSCLRSIFSLLSINMLVCHPEKTDIVRHFTSQFDQHAPISVISKFLAQDNDFPAF